MENNQNQDVTIDNKYLISVLEQENNQLIHENRILKAYIEQLKHVKNEPDQQE
ncbi:hypothetical protein HLE67_001307 [Staphylococcus pseudintermedius]|nr:hypothetical protein [Staphylococcus pseudintermedius]